jgi:hypothetical protein
MPGLFSYKEAFAIGTCSEEELRPLLVSHLISPSDGKLFQTHDIHLFLVYFKPNLDFSFRNKIDFPRFL